MTEAPVKAIVIGVGVFLLLFVILLASSFSYIEYYEMGFFKRKSTGNVDTSEVYTSGRYIIGPDAEFKTFNSDIHFETLSNIAVFTSDKLEIKLTVHFQYLLRKDDLNLLHKNYNLAYKPVVRSSAQDALKGVTTTYETNQFVSQRKNVENTLFTAVKNRLEGSCCIKGCVSGDITQDNACTVGCKAYASCVDEDKGLFVEVKSFQLTDVDLPPSIAEKFMKALTLQEDTAKEKFNQDAALVEKQTDLEVKGFDNQALEVAANATAQSSLIKSRASANATAIIENARMTGLKALYDTIGITQQNYRNSFDYLRSLKDMPNAHLAIDFTQLIVGPMKSP